MTNDPAWQRDLKELTKQQPTDQDRQRIVDEIFDEADDRGAALIMVGQVEAALESYLHIYARNLSGGASSNRLLGRGGPLDSFSTRILAAHALGMIRTQERTDLDRLREIRNTFAHCRIPITFETPAIAAACDGFINRGALAGGRHPPDHPRSKFMGSAWEVMASMSLGFTNALRDPPPPSPDTLPQLATRQPRVTVRLPPTSQEPQAQPSTSKE